MATTRLLRSSNKPLGRTFASSSSWPSSSPVKNVRCLSKGGLAGEKVACGNGDERKPTVAMKACVAEAESAVTSKPQVNWGKELAFLLAKAIDSLRQLVIRPVLKPARPWKSHVQMLIQKVIIDCRFFTMLAVGGSLLGSILCFMEGCFLVLESYLQYFHSLSQKSDQEHIIHLLIEAIDMFLVGTAMIMFGMGLYIMFVGTSKTMKGGLPSLPRSNLFGLFHLKRIPAWVEMKSVSEAKSKIGHAVMMILQVGVLEKFNSTPLVSSMDLACFAAAVFVSSASIFVLSRLSFGSTMGDR